MLEVSPTHVTRHAPVPAQQISYLLSPGTEAVAVVAFRSGRGGRVLTCAHMAMAALLLLLLLHRAAAGGGDQVCESGQSAADPSPTWHGPAAWSRRRLAAMIWWRAVASSRLSRYTRDSCVPVRIAMFGCPDVIV